MPFNEPELVDFSSGRLERISRLMQAYIDRKDLAGIAAAVSRRGQVVYQETFGMMDAEAGKAMPPDAIFRIASMTKPVTSVAAMMLYEEGKFQLNTPVSKFIPAFADLQVYAGEDETGMRLEALERPVTFRHLFTHTAGLGYGFDPSNPVDKLIIERNRQFEQAGAEITMKQMVEELVKIPLGFQPGTRWRYGMGMEVLGHIVEIISGQTLDQFMRERIFEPLGMTDTAFHVPVEKLDRVAALYGHLPEQAGLQRFPDRELPHQPPAMQSGGGGLFSTLPDYARFLQMLVNGGYVNGTRLLSPRTVALYSMNHAPEQALPYGFAPKEDQYHAGYGFSLGTRVLMDVSKTGFYGSVGEFGWDGAFGTYFWVDPRLELYGIMMIQHYPNAYFPIAQEFKQLTYQAMIV